MPLVLVTVPASDGKRLARDLVEARLAASVNRVHCSSTYRWDGDVQSADEELLLVQTTADRYDDVVDLVERRHPYTVPPVQRFDESDALDAFLEWRRGSIADDSGTENQ